MARQDMNVAQTGYSIGQDRGWEKEVISNNIGFSEWTIIPEKIRYISVTLSFTGGASGLIQTSTDKVDIVRNGSPVPIDWPFGIIDAERSEVCKPVSALRLNQVTSGSIKMTLRAQ